MLASHRLYTFSKKDSFPHILSLQLEQILQTGKFRSMKNEFVYYKYGTQQVKKDFNRYQLHFIGVLIVVAWFMI